MRIGEAPRWRVVHYDGRTGRGVVRGVGELPFESRVPDFLEDEPVFVSLRDAETVKAVWPLVGHPPLEVDEALRAEAEQLVAAPWTARVSAVLGGLPVPFSALLLAPTRLVGVEVTRNEYVPWGADVTVTGELELTVRHQTAPLFSGGLAVRVATPLERAWAARQGWDPALSVVAVGAAAGHLAPSRAAPLVTLCAVEEVQWFTHSAAETAPLDRALVASWCDEGPRRLVAAAGQVSLEGPGAPVVLGQVEPRHATRWVLAMNDCLASDEG